LLFFAASTLSPLLATDHIVGANRGWNPGINYTLWANNHTFYVGDLICNSSFSLSLSNLYLSVPLSTCLYSGSVSRLKIQNPLFVSLFLWWNEFQTHARLITFFSQFYFLLQRLGTKRTSTMCLR